MKITIAAYQMRISPFNLKKNLENIEKAAKKSAERKANFFVIPEKCWSGPFYKETYKNEVAEFVMEHATRISKKYGFYFIAGSLHQIKHELGDHVHNISYLFGPQGEEIGWYAKRHLFKGEVTGRVIPGKSHKVFDTEFGKVGIQICRDVLYPESTKIMGDLGAKIVFSPALWSKFSSEYDSSVNKNTMSMMKFKQSNILSQLELWKMSSFLYLQMLQVLM